MSNGRSNLDILAGLFAGSDSDDDSDFNDDATIASNETGGDSYFDELSLPTEDNIDIYRQGTGQGGDDLDDASDTSRARADHCAGDLPRNDRHDSKQHVHGSTAAVAASGHTTAQPTCNNSTGDVVDDQGGATDVSTSPRVKLIIRDFSN